MKNQSESKASEHSVDRPVRESFAHCAWLHRKGKPTWLFRPDPRYGQLSHTTRAGTVYLIEPGLHSGKPFWIGQVSGKTIFTVERELRSQEIEFANGGRYIFPNVSDHGRLPVAETQPSPKASNG
jgi:hypothetical protein